MQAISRRDKKKKVNRFGYANDISMKITQIMELIQDDKKANYIHTSILANISCSYYIITSNCYVCTDGVHSIASMMLHVSNRNDGTLCSPFCYP